MDPDNNNQPSPDIPPVPQLSAIPPKTPVVTPPPPPVSEDGERDPVKDDKYAQSLLHMANMKYEMEQAHKPKQRIMSTKRLIYLGIVIVTVILSFIIAPLLIKSKSTGSDSTTSHLPNYPNTRS